MYPYQKLLVPERGQGLIRLRMTQLEPGPRFKCTGCGICEKNCPQHCIIVSKMENDKQPETYTVDYGLCMFCRICIDVCPFKALEQTQEYEFIGEERSDFIRPKEQLMMKTVFIDKVKEEVKEESI
ncbi:MAG: 4Fe-4S binding protein [Candidatus Humimicrobiaceae bacterium]